MAENVGFEFLQNTTKAWKNSNILHMSNFILKKKHLANGYFHVIVMPCEGNHHTVKQVFTYHRETKAETEIFISFPKVTVFSFPVFISFDALRNILHRWVMSQVNSFYCMYIQMDQVWMQDCFYLQSKAELFVHIFSASSSKCLLCFH